MSGPGLTLDFSALSRLPTDRELPYSDGEPMDSPWHRACMTLLIDTLEWHRRGQKDFYCGGDMFVYFSKERVFNKDFRGPDFFVVNGVEHDRPRLSWVVWNEGKHPDVIVELVSPSTADVDRGPKRELYRDTFRTPEYYIYDPAAGTFDGYRRFNGSAEPLEIEPGNRVWSRALELYLGTWDGEYLGLTGRWVRFFDARGNLVPTKGEAEAARADRAAEQLEAESAARKQAEREAVAAKEQAFRDRERAAMAAERADREAKRAECEAAQARAAEAEIARLKQELDALRRQPPPAP